MIRTLSLAPVIVLLACAPFAAADIGPKPLTFGFTPAASGEDMPGIEVEMAEETVDLVLSRISEEHDRLEVRASFTMKNHGETATFETGFPVGTFENFTAFSIEIDGETVPFRKVSRGEGKGRTEWYVWQATYSGHAVSRHLVRYTVGISRRAFSQLYAGYTLRTGSPWKGPIGKAVITLRCGAGLTLDQVHRFEPHAGGRREADRVVWTHTAFEPTKAHDITFYYGDGNLEVALAKARLEARTRWSARASVVAHLGRRPGFFLRDRMTPTELEEYLDAVAALVEGLQEDGGRIVLPRTDAEGDRSYVSSPSNLLRWIDRAAEIVAKYPESERAKELLAVFLRIGEHFLEGTLYAGDEQLALPWRGAVDTEKARARRDASIHKRRVEITSWIERGRSALAGR